MEAKKGQIVQLWNGMTGEVLETFAAKAHILFTTGKRAWEPMSQIVQAADTFSEKDARFLSAKDRLMAFKAKKASTALPADLREKLTEMQKGGKITVTWPEAQTLTDYFDENPGQEAQDYFKYAVSMPNPEEKRPRGTMVLYYDRTGKRAGHPNDFSTKALSDVTGADLVQAMDDLYNQEITASGDVEHFSKVFDEWIQKLREALQSEDSMSKLKEMKGQGPSLNPDNYAGKKTRALMSILGIPDAKNLTDLVEKLKGSLTKTAGHPNDFSTKYRIGDIIVPEETKQCPELGYIHVLDVDTEKKVYVLEKRPVADLDLSKQEPAQAYGVRYEVSIKELDGDKKLVKYSAADPAAGCPADLVAISKEGASVRLVFSADTAEKADWQVRVYDKGQKELSNWVIKNRTEHEAEDEASADAAKVEGYADWSMTKVGSFSADYAENGDLISTTASDIQFAPEFRAHFGAMVKDLGFEKLSTTVAQKRLARKVEAMGRSTRPKYRVEVNQYQVFPMSVMTPAAWDVKYGGRPTPENVEKYVELYNASLEPDGANSHLGPQGAIYGAKVIDQDTGETVAEWKDEAIIQQYKSRPKFEVIESKTKEAAANSEVINVFLQDSFPKDKMPVWGTPNLKITKKPNGWALVNYATPILYRDANGKVVFNTQRYSATTSTIQNAIRAALQETGISAEETDETGINAAISATVKTSAKKDIFTIGVYNETQEEGMDGPMNVTGISYYTGDEAAAAAKKLAEGYAGEEDDISVTVYAGEYEDGKGNVWGEPVDIETFYNHPKASAEKTAASEDLKKAYEAAKGKKAAAERYKSDADIAAEFEGLKVTEFKITPRQGRPDMLDIGMELEFPQAGESVGGGREEEDNPSYVYEWVVAREENGEWSIMPGLHNWYPEPVYNRIISEIKSRFEKEMGKQLSVSASRKTTIKIASLMKKADRLGNYEFDVHHDETWKLEAAEDGGEKRLVRVRR